MTLQFAFTDDRGNVCSAAYARVVKFEIATVGERDRLPQGDRLLNWKSQAYNGFFACSPDKPLYIGG